MGYFTHRDPAIDILGLGHRSVKCKSRTQGYVKTKRRRTFATQGYVKIKRRRTFATGAACQQRTLEINSSGHLVLSNFGTCMCSNVETNLSWTCLVSRTFEFRKSLGTSVLHANHNVALIYHVKMSNWCKCIGWDTYKYCKYRLNHFVLTMVTQTWNEGQGQKPPCDVSGSC